jgi:tetraacyldisaccharide 4'-kinase
LSEAPPFWWQEPDWRAYALYPLSRIYGVVAARRMHSAKREKIDAPVLCIGNFTVGGTGKTPVAIAFAKQARRMNLRPGFLSRGHGGTFVKPHLVDRHHDSARHVGDEPLLLADHGLVAVTPNRAAGAAMLIEQGCNFLIMDDGFQSARIHIDYSLIVVDGRYGLGNGHVIPGGPMRARLVDQLPFATGILKMGEERGGDAVVRLASRAGKPVLAGTVRPNHPERLAGKRYLAFAGIGHPDKFYDTIVKAGGEIGQTRSFADHHFFAPDEVAELAASARAAGLQLITTSKDAARLRNGGAPAEFLQELQILEIEAVFESLDTVERIIDETVEAWRYRRHQKQKS